MLKENIRYVEINNFFILTNQTFKTILEIYAPVVYKAPWKARELSSQAFFFFCYLDLKQVYCFNPPGSEDNLLHMSF